MTLSLNHLTGFGAAPVPSVTWTPAELFTPGVTGGWYDVNVLSSLFEETSGGGSTPAVLNGPVGMVRDLSANANHLYAPSTAGRPILRLDGVGYYLEFDGVDDSMISATSLAMHEPAFVGFSGQLNSSIASANSVWGIHLNNGVMISFTHVSGTAGLRARAIHSGSAALDFSAAGKAPLNTGLAAMLWADATSIRARFTDDTEASDLVGSYTNASAGNGRIRIHGITSIAGKHRALIVALNCPTDASQRASAHAWLKSKSGVS